MRNCWPIMVDMLGFTLSSFRDLNIFNNPDEM